MAAALAHDIGQAVADVVEELRRNGLIDEERSAHTASLALWWAFTYIHPQICQLMLCIHITFLVALVINFSLLVDMLGGIISVP